MSYFEAIDNDQAPRIKTAWNAIRAVLDDGHWHTHSELITAATSTGVADRTALNLLTEARKSPRRLAASGHHGTSRLYRRLDAA